MYKILRSLLFLLPAETAHYFSMNILKAFCSVGLLRKIISRQFSVPGTALARNFFGLNFVNPVGLGAGFDKNAKYLRELKTLGFGFVEIGTVTPRPQAGNDRPRLFRLPKDEALINRMGFNNDGVDVVAKRLKIWREKDRRWHRGNNRKTSAPGQQNYFLIGGNIGKNKTTPNEDAWKDYEICFRTLHPYVDFFVVNVSSPNTPGLRELQEKDSLSRILTHLQQLNQGFTEQKPILLKIAPDLTLSQTDDVIELAQKINLDGLVATNTTISREELKTPDAELQTVGAGGLSGRPLQKHSTKIVQYIHQKTNGSIPVIGSGGIFTGEDARQKFSAGAVLVEVWTGFIYEGPFIVKRICKALQASH
ncbi:MAG TPA: quinone-dependent dihydroorotate dehydrogenase [Flavisolibacter sp.]|nr:quinone-dependent dihydroorotate dehydrogenase [Flavisolibacter sp.]